MDFNQSIILAAALILLSACNSSNPTASKSAELKTKPQVKVKDVKPKTTNPFLTPGTCRTVYIVSSNQDTILGELRRQERVYKRLGGRYGIYKISNGQFIGAETMERYYENPRKFLKKQGKTTIGNKRARIKDRIQRAKFGKKQHFLPTSYCSTGEEIIADTGKRYYNPTSTGSGGLLLSVASKSYKALKQASADAGQVTSAPPNNSASSTKSENSPGQIKKISKEKGLSIRQSGRSASGKNAFSIECPSGRSFRIWTANGQWWDARGAQGGNSRSLEQQAKYLCS